MVGLGQKYLKRRWNRKERKRNKDFKEGEQAGPRGGCLKKGAGGGGAGTPLRTMRPFLTVIHLLKSSTVGNFMVRYYGRPKKCLL